MPIFKESAEDKMTSMTIILMRSMTNTPRKKNVMTMTTVGCFHFVTEDWEYVFVEKESTVFSRDVVDVIAKVNGTEYATLEQEDVPAEMTKKQAGERDVPLNNLQLH